MKIHSAIAVLAFAVLGTAAHAQTKIYITGSTAYRSVTNAQVQALLGGGAPTASTNATLGSANALTFTGTFSGTPVVIKLAYTGSAGGVQTVAGTDTVTSQRLRVKFLQDGATGTSNLDPNDISNPNPNFELATPDIAFSDVYQATTPFKAGVTLATTPNPTSYEGLVDNVIGVVGFRWVASNGFPANLSMTNKLVNTLFSGSTGTPLAMWTGLNADHNKIVFGTGRNFDSGTRLTAFAEAGYGVAKQVRQWKPTISGNNVTAHQLYPIETLYGLSTLSLGNSGEVSGSTLRNFLTKTLNAAVYNPDPEAEIQMTAGYYITYLGASDASSVLTGPALPAVAMKWNGADYGVQAIQEGSYTFWSYLHMFWRNSISGVHSTFATTLRQNILNANEAAVSPNVKYQTMQVSRPTDGAAVSPVYF